MSKFASEVRQAMQQISTKSFLNPLLWLCGLVTIPGFFAAVLTSGIIQIAFFLVALIPLALISLMVLKYQGRPELFQSEEYRLKDQALRVFGDRHELDALALSRIVDPQPWTLEDLREGSKND